MFYTLPLRTVASTGAKANDSSSFCNRVVESNAGAGVAGASIGGTSSGAVSAPSTSYSSQSKQNNIYRIY